MIIESVADYDGAINLKLAIKALAAILGASWFFPVSCTTGAVVGQKLLPILDERHVEKGDMVHSTFTVVAEPGANGKPFGGIRLDQLPALEKSGKPMSFWMSKPSGNINSGNSRIEYKVVSESGTERLIEVAESDHDGDKTVWSRYKVTGSTVTPVSSRMTYFGYMFNAVIYAFVISLFLLIAGRVLKWIVGRNKEAGA